MTPPTHRHDPVQKFLNPESRLLLHCYRNGTSMLAQPEFELPPHPSKQEIPL